MAIRLRKDPGVQMSDMIDCDECGKVVPRSEAHFIVSDTLCTECVKAIYSKVKAQVKES